MAFRSRIRLENVTDLLACSAPCYNIGDQFHDHFRQGRTSEQKIEKINFMVPPSEIFYFYFFKTHQEDILTSPVLLLITKTVWQTRFGPPLREVKHC
jgi:hypothetical protein